MGHGDDCEELYIGMTRCSQIVEAMLQLGFVEAYGKRCDSLPVPFSSKCFIDDMEFVQPGLRPLHFDVFPFGDQCWAPFGVNAAQMRRDCCSSVQAGNDKGCWDEVHSRA